MLSRLPGIRRPLGIFLVLAILSPVALAQFSKNPFFDYTEALGAAHGMEMLDMRLGGLALTDDLDDFDEQIEGAFARDLPRFLPSLAMHDPELAEELSELVEELEELVEEDELAGIGVLATEAREIVDQARSLVVSSELWQMPDFVAALMATLLLAEEGVAERFEETVAGEEAAFPGGWVGQQRVKELWALLEPMASDNQRFEVNEMLAELDGLFPSAELPAPEALTDAEAGEDPAQRIVGFLEEISDASLYPDRDLGQMIVLTQGLVESACEALEGGDEGQGEQQLAIAGFYYAQYVGGTVGLLAPEINEALEPLWFAFSEESEGDDDDEGEEEGDDDDEEHDDDDDDGDEIDCQELLEQLEAAGNFFGI